jgi:hypothetical protein
MDYISVSLKIVYSPDMVISWAEVKPGTRLKLRSSWLCRAGLCSWCKLLEGYELLNYI